MDVGGVGSAGGVGDVNKENFLLSMLNFQKFCSNLVQYDEEIVKVTRVDEQRTAMISQAIETEMMKSTNNESFRRCFDYLEQLKASQNLSNQQRLDLNQVLSNNSSQWAPLFHQYLISR
jgi:excinuclease UvrABC nuclease subunit